MLDMLLEERCREMLRERNAEYLVLARRRAAGIRETAEGAREATERLGRDIDWIERSQNRNNVGRTAAAALDNFRVRLDRAEAPIRRAHRRLDRMTNSQKVLDRRIEALGEMLQRQETALEKLVRDGVARFGIQSFRSLDRRVTAATVRLSAFAEGRKRATRKNEETRRTGLSRTRALESRMCSIEGRMGHIQQGLEEAHRHALALLDAL